jgi:site-specific DNA-cytosine methylase
MKRDLMSLPIDVGNGARAIRTIDLFAGAGGFSEGAMQAGCEAVWAANHWPVTVDDTARTSRS